MAKTENAVYITEDDVGKGACFIYGRFKSKRLQIKKGLSQESVVNVDAFAFAEEMRLATFSLQDNFDFERESDEYDCFAFCGWKSKREGFERAVRKFENLGARKLSSEEMAGELGNPGLSWILGYELTQDETREILEQN